MEGKEVESAPPAFSISSAVGSTQLVTAPTRRLFLERARSFGQNLIEELADRSLRFQY